MKDYASMSDFEINKLVANSLGNVQVGQVSDEIGGSEVQYTVYKNSGLNREGMVNMRPCLIKKDFCNNPADAWPIIVENGITLAFQDGNWWADNLAYWVDGVEWSIGGIIGKNPLRAAMIVFLMMKESENE